MTSLRFILAGKSVRPQSHDMGVGMTRAFHEGVTDGGASSGISRGGRSIRVGGESRRRRRRYGDGRARMCG